MVDGGAHSLEFSNCARTAIIAFNYWVLTENVLCWLFGERVAISAKSFRIVE